MSTTFPGLDVLRGSRYCDRLVVGVSGAVSASVVPLFLTTARMGFAREVRVFMTEHATRFVTPFAIHTAAGSEPVIDQFRNGELLVPHIEALSGADAMVVVPATANLLAKAAHGIGDDAVTTALLAARCPVVFVPSMNEAMWEHPAVSGNVATLRGRGHRVTDPELGIEVATMQLMLGAMPDFSSIFAVLWEALQRPPS
jgi:phosphopantothenoylcysteine decarboxylase/phosphopantothenate--cysteine ligase